MLVPRVHTLQTRMLMQRLIATLGLTAALIACSTSNPEDARIQECQVRVADLDGRIQEVTAHLKEVEATASRLSELTKGQEQAIAATKAMLKAKESELNQREAVVAKATEAVRASSFGDGTWEVGRDIQAGKYRTDNPSGKCYWEKSTGGEGVHSIIGNDNAVGPTTVVISSHVPYFKSNGCGTWRKLP